MTRQVLKKIFQHIWMSFTPYIFLLQIFEHEWAWKETCCHLLEKVDVIVATPRPLLAGPLRCTSRARMSVKTEVLPPSEETTYISELLASRTPISLHVSMYCRGGKSTLLLSAATSRIIHSSHIHSERFEHEWIWTHKCSVAWRKSRKSFTIPFRISLCETARSKRYKSIK